MSISLASFLDLKPLDRVQLNDRREIYDMQISVQLGYGQTDLPYLYFQRICSNGRLELCGPSGYVTSALPADICDVIAGQEIKVRAMPRAAFIARLSLPLSQRQTAPPEECYAPASVLRVEKDRWGRVDRVFVYFDDPALNEERAMPAPIHPEDRPLVSSKARRTCMPVISKSSGSRSADHGVTSATQKTRYAAQVFLHGALAGHRSLTSAISGIGITSLSTAQINRLRAIQGQ